MKMFVLNISIVLFGIFSMACVPKTKTYYHNINGSDINVSMPMNEEFSLEYVRRNGYSLAYAKGYDLNITQPATLGTATVEGKSIHYVSNQTAGLDSFVNTYTVRILYDNISYYYYTRKVNITIFDPNHLSEDINSTPIFSGVIDPVDINLSVPSIPDNTTLKFLSIKSLPDMTQGTLYMQDGTTEVTKDQNLTLNEAENLKFVPSPDNATDVKFTYASIIELNNFSKVGLYFNTVNTYDFTSTPDLVVEDPTPATFTIPMNGIPRVTISKANATEGNDLLFDINLSKTISTPVDLTISTQNGTAKEGEDYTGLTNTMVSIPAGDRGYELSIPSDIDGIYEGSETFKVIVEVTSANTVNTDLNTTGTILDADAPPTLTISDTNATEGNNLVFDINLSHPSSFTTVIDLNTSGDTADEDVDFSSIKDTVTISAGAKGTTASVTTADDTDIEDDETFTLYGTVTSENTANTEINATGTIIDNDTSTANIPPETVNVNNSQLISIHDGPVDIDDLQGYDTDGSVTGFKITTLPDPAQGTLYMSDGTTAVTLNQVLTLTEVAGLKFDPEVQYDSPASAFLYAAIDDKGAEDSTDAIFMIPLYDPSPQIPGQDNDSDGFSPPEDCDDNNVLVNPDIPEDPLNGIDDNCDGQVDETGIV